MSSTMAKTQGRLVVTEDEVQPQEVWTRGRKITAALAVLMPLGVSVLTARFGTSNVAVGILVLCLAVAVGFLVSTTRGSGGRHRA